MSEPIKIWSFYDAPQELRQLSEHGGDEEWVALVPAQLDDEFLVQTFFTQDYLHRNPFGVCDIQKCKLQDGNFAYIGAHA